MHPGALLEATRKARPNVVVDALHQLLSAHLTASDKCANKANNGCTTNGAGRPRVPKVSKPSDRSESGNGGNQPEQLPQECLARVLTL
ncbi:hypothetical protein Thiosp_03260 [Thiorhodovibrio litoralis]|nr:hypothetical protein Thiosp_03260 [Thiorhodovibrio litoralis]